MASKGKKIADLVSAWLNERDGYTDDCGFQPWCEPFQSQSCWRPKVPKVAGQLNVYVAPIDWDFLSEERDRCGCPRVFETHVVLVEKPVGKDPKEEHNTERLDAVIGLAEQIAAAWCSFRGQLDHGITMYTLPEPAPYFNEGYLDRHGLIIASVALFLKCNG